MGLFDFIEDMTKAAVNTVLVPLDAARDVLDPDDNDDPHTIRRVRRVLDNLSDAEDDLFS